MNQKAANVWHLKPDRRFADRPASTYIAQFRGLRQHGTGVHAEINRRAHLGRQQLREQHIRFDDQTGIAIAPEPGQLDFRGRRR